MISRKQRNEILRLFTEDLTIKDVASIIGVSVGTVHSLWQQQYGVEACKERRSRLTSGEKHHNWKGGVTTTAKGYRLIRAPEWYTGCVDDAGRAPEHMVNWCMFNGKTEVPEGHIIHHRNEIKDDNTEDNLELLSKSEHTSTHAAKRDRYWDGKFV